MNQLTPTALSNPPRPKQRYVKLTAGGKNKNQTVTAVGRELLGFIWDIAVRTERAWEQTKAA